MLCKNFQSKEIIKKIKKYRQSVGIKFQKSIKI
jgi:hypothetical protein